MSCNLQIVDINASRMMIIAGSMIILGLIIPPPIGLGLYFLGWLFVGYNLEKTMPENNWIFWPAITGILISTFGFKLISRDNMFFYISIVTYIISWLVFGYNISGHLSLEDRLIGLVAAVLAIVSTLYISNPFGAAGYTISWGAMTSIYSIPTLTTLVTDILPCASELAPSNPEIQCILNSQCFTKLLQSGLSGTQYINELINAINCAANTCDSGWFKTVANKIKCYQAAGCLTNIENNPPTTPSELVIALVGLYSCDKNC